MKIAIPCVENKLCLHFGHCQEFCVLSINEESKQVEAKEMMTPPPHEPGVLPKWLADKDVNVIISGGMGSRAQALFQQSGIKVVVGAPCEDPEKIAALYLEDKLTTGSNTCDH